MRGAAVVAVPALLAFIISFAMDRRKGANTTGSGK